MYRSLLGAPKILVHQHVRCFFSVGFAGDHCEKLGDMVQPVDMKVFLLLVSPWRQAMDKFVKDEEERGAGR